MFLRLYICITVKNNHLIYTAERVTVHEAFLLNCYIQKHTSSAPLTYGDILQHQTCTHNYMLIL